MSVMNQTAHPPVSNTMDQTALFAARINRALKAEIHGDTVIVTPTGDLGDFRYKDIHLDVGRINDLLVRDDCRNVLIDMSADPALGTVVMTALVGFCRSVKGAAAFCHVSDEMRESLNSARIGSLWPQFATRAEALETL
jgi:hypothetical protein